MRLAEKSGYWSKSKHAREEAEAIYQDFEKTSHRVRPEKVLIEIAHLTRPIQDQNISMMMKRAPVSRSTCCNLASRQRTVSVSASNALIVNCKSGGHAFVGYYLANALLAKGHTVTIMNDGDEVKT